MIQFVVGARVQRIGKSWGNIKNGAIGEVKEIIDFGKKLRVLFDDYTSEREDGTVIVMAKSLGFAPLPTDRVVNRMVVNEKAPIRPDPFRGPVPPGMKRLSESHRISATEAISTGRIGKLRVVSVEHVDLTVPFHKQVPPRAPDWIHMSDYSDSCEIEGLVGEGFEDDDQEELAQRIDDRLERAARAPKQEMSPRAQIRPMLPFTAWEREMRKRKLGPRDLMKVETVDGFTACYRERGETLQGALDATLRVDPLPNK